MEQTPDSRIYVLTMDNCFSAEVQGELAGQKIVFSTNNARTIGHPYANKKRERELIHVLYHVQKLTQNR